MNEKKILNVLMLEDQAADALLIKRCVKKAFPNAVFNVARNKSEFIEKLDWAVPDVVLADYNLPDYNGLEALLFLRETRPRLPFVFVSGTLNNEEKVAEALLKGASGYVLKDNLEPLPETLTRVLEQSEAEQKEAQERERRQRESSLALQKANAILVNAPDFEQKEELIRLLSGLLDDCE